MKKLGLSGGVTFQRPLPENPKFVYKMHFSTLVLQLAFFSLVFTKVGHCVCVLFSNVLCCLDFGVWIIELKFSPFFLLFSSPFLTLTFFFLFFPLLLLSLEPLVLLMPCRLIVPCVASSYYLVASSCCLNLLPCHTASLPCRIALSHCLIALPHRTTSLPHHAA